MTAINTIFDNDWDATICTKPSFINLAKNSTVFYSRVVGTVIETNDDKVKDALDRKFYDPDSYDAYRLEIVSETSEADLKNMIKAIKKVCSTYTPTSAENVIDWDRGVYNYWNEMRWEFTITILIYKAGIASY